MSTYNELLKPTMGQLELFRLFSLSDEFKYVTVRRDEKMELAQLLDRVPVRSMEVWNSQNAGRLLRAIFEIVLKRGWAQVAEKALNLCKMVEKRMWRVQTPLRQFNVLTVKLEKKDLDWERHFDLSPQELGQLIRMPKMGRTLHKFIHHFPKLNLAAHVQPITSTVLKIELNIAPDFQWEDKFHGYVEPFWVILEDNDGEYILHHEYFLLKKQWLRSETVLPVSFKHLMLPEKNTSPTELLDLEPLPVAALRNPLYEALYDHDFKCFNPIQTQVFTVFYNSDDNVLVAAPTGSGKTLCADIAVLRNHQKGTQSDSHAMRVVYIAPSDNERYRDWEGKFGKGLKLCVGKLIGERSRDLKQLQKYHIIISTPENWDALSRHWKQNKNVQQVSLFIVDELHLIGGQGGPVLEAIVSRMRYISSQTENKIRIALSTSLANAKDLKVWIGATSHGLFNFPPEARPVPLKIRIQGVEYADFEARMQAMMKPTYTAIVQHAKNIAKPALVYVPTKKHIRLTAENLVTYSYADSGEKPPFLLRPLDGHIESLIGRLNDGILQSTLHGGVGYLHEGLTLSDQQILSRLFEDGWIQVSVVSSSMCWGVSLFAHLVVVRGTQYYDSRENVHTDYHVTELLQMMMGHANRPLLDDSGKCVILCHAPRRVFFMLTEFVRVQEMSIITKLSLLIKNMI
ncbi:unnamed protein product [Prunus armeniaca]|uniref:Helicase ATP-binding domain-containing protein n=1 Tax=Prunus armeniaca TaxID=36596 RepID=A0A6J5UL32_PRUAR|nr:unnamed protein product [Prunus armeniaca]